MMTVLRYWMGALLLAVLAVGAAEPEASLRCRQDPQRAASLQLLEDLEDCRMLLGAAMWMVHDLRNFALYSGRRTTFAQKYDQESLRLFELLKPLDFAASSLWEAIGLGDDRTADVDVIFLRGELAAAAAQVKEHFDEVAAEHRKELSRLQRRGRLQLKTIPGIPWTDPVREYQRQVGVQVGWRTNIEPPAAFRETFWNQRQHLDVRYQLAKGRKLGVDFLVAKDPWLRWDLLEPQPGRYDFAAFDRFMKLAISSGYRVKLIVPTMGGGVPDWWLKQRPEGAIRDAKGNADFTIHSKTYAHDFMGPQGRPEELGDWYRGRSVNLLDQPTRERYALLVQALARHCAAQQYNQHILAISVELFYAERHWRVPPETDLRDYIFRHYRQAAQLYQKNFSPIPVDLEVSDGEAHNIDNDFSAHEWRSFGLSQVVDLPGVDSETPFFEDLMRAGALAAARERLGKDLEAGPFFYQNCEYGFGTMLSINYFTSLLRDGLWSDGWFGPEGILRWGYFPQIFTANDRQLQWAGVTNSYLAHRQAHALSATIANTRVTPADVILLLPSSTLDVKGFQAQREVVGWGWALTALKMPYDVISELQLTADGVPVRTRLLILPQVAELNEKQVQAIRRFVAGGGLLLSSLVPGTKGAQPSPLADVLGCDLQRQNEQPVLVSQTGVKGTWLQTTVNRGLHSGKYAEVPDPDAGYPRTVEGRRQQHDQAYQTLSPTAAEIWNRYGNGQAAIAMNRFGKGGALTLGYPYGHELVFADWTSIAFGKIYNGFARDRQIVEMVRWLRDALARMGYVRQTTAPEGWRYRLQGFEAAVSSLSYPKGPDPEELKPWFGSFTYLDSRRSHRIEEEHDDMDYAFELTWRDRPGVNTRYLAVANRESAYAGDRAACQFWVMPHRVRILVRNPGIRQVFDVAAGVPVTFQRDADGISFETTVPPALGRVFAVSETDTVDLFAGAGELPGVSFEALAERVAKMAMTRKRRPPLTVLHDDDIREWLQVHQARPITICYGDSDYEKAARKLAEWLTKQFRMEVALKATDGKFWIVGNENFQVTFAPTEAQILIGNAWSNNSIAALDATWPYNNGDSQALPESRLTATCAWPGDDRGVVTLTRELAFRRRDHTAFNQQYGGLQDLAPRTVDAAGKEFHKRKLLILASTTDGAKDAVDELQEVLRVPSQDALTPYEKPGQLELPPAGKATLYATPWRAHVRVASAQAALDGIGIYYKHIPNEWSEAANVRVMQQLAAAGIRRVRLAPHHAIYIDKDWTKPEDKELLGLRRHLRAAKQAGIRPCVTFVHIPPFGKAGTDELQKWWKRPWNKDLLPVGEVGSAEFGAYVKKTYEALLFILKEARDAGFTAADSYDLEMGQGLWWGAPAIPLPFPSTTLRDLRPGGRIYEFENALIKQLRADGYKEPTLWWAQTHHLFGECADEDVPPTCAGRAISFYSAWCGTVNEGWLTGDQYDSDKRGRGVRDTWPERPVLSWLEPGTPRLVLAKPEGWMADRSRHDNLIELMAKSQTPVAISSLGTVPADIPDFDQSPIDGWEAKGRGLTRSLAFWLNQGAPFVLLHSALEPGRPAGGELDHSLIPNTIDPEQFTWEHSRPLQVLRRFCDGLKGAKPLKEIGRLNFQYRLDPDTVLIPESKGGKRLTAADCVAVLPFQLDANRYAIAVYVVTPNLARALPAQRLTLAIDKALVPTSLGIARPFNDLQGRPVVLSSSPLQTVLRFDIHDDVTWLRFEVAQPSTTPAP